MANVNQSKRPVYPRFVISLLLIALALGFVRTRAAGANPYSGSANTLPNSQTSDGPTDPGEFEAFLDPLVTELMVANHVPGGAISVVKNGQLFFAQGYGYADLERGVPATADATIFRAGSISKVFTWTAVMQLVEQGKLDLNADINTYLTHFKIPATFAQPITLAQLMTHTAGFEEQIINGATYASAEAYRPLRDFLAAKIPERIFPPGQVVAYSNYGAALAGQIVADVSGESFDEYITNHILGPLEMGYSTFQQPLPPELAVDAAVSYSVDQDGLAHAGVFEYVQVQPAGALSATAADMANFMIAHLQDGRFVDKHILQPESAQDMRRQYYAFNPRLPGITRGFMEARRNNIHLVFHVGSTDLTSSLLALLPDQNIGVFMTFNSYISTPIRLAFLNTILDRYYPGTTPSLTSPPANFEANSANFKGNYLTSRRAETTIEKLNSPLKEVAVRSNPDGTLQVDAFRDSSGVPIRWLEVEPLVFQESGGQGLLAFHTDAQGQITTMFYGDQPILVFQKLAWFADPKVHVAGLGLALLVFAFTLVIWPLSWLVLRLRSQPPIHNRLERSGRFLAFGLILLNLVIVGLVVSVLVGDDSAMQLGYPAGFAIAGVLALVSAAGAIILLAWTVGAWRQRAWGIGGRLHFTLVAGAALYFAWYLYQVNLLLP